MLRAGYSLNFHHNPIIEDYLYFFFTEEETMAKLSWEIKGGGLDHESAVSSLTLSVFLHVSRQAAVGLVGAARVRALFSKSKREF